MRRILCYGSANIDHVYHVDRFVLPGETMACNYHAIFPGGKGFNQAIALARAGCTTYFAGMIGPDASFMKNLLEEDCVNTSLLKTTQTPTGHTIIQVDRSGQNCILLYPGANNEISVECIRETLSGFGPSDLLLIQNELPHLRELIRCGSEQGMSVYLNPSPVPKDIPLQELLSGVDCLLLNAVEGEALTGCVEPSNIFRVLRDITPNLEVVLTLGENGVCYSGPVGEYSCAAQKVTTVDTTAAGDTFTGYYLAARMEKLPVPQALEFACKAAAIAVATPGAAVSIPRRAAVV